MEYNIRAVCMRDCEGINRLRRMPGVFENILGRPSERVMDTEAFIQNLGKDDHEFVAVIPDETGRETVIACGGLHIFPNPRLRHSAGIGLMVHADYQNRGIGTKMMETILDVADNWLMLKRLELGVFTDNVRAIKLYEKMGFVQEGIKRNAAIRNGEYIDEMMMARLK